MIASFPISLLCAVAFVASTFLVSISFRLRSLLRAFALSSLCMALLSVILGMKNDALEEPLLFFGLIVGVKVILIPWLLRKTASHSGAPERLQSFVRPATNAFLIAGILGITVFGVRNNPFEHSVFPTYFLSLAIATVLIGFAMMILRKDILSQIVGFLTLENGISMFAIATIGSFPLLIELNVLLVLIFGALLMANLFLHVQKIYGAPDTSLLQELTD